MPKPATGIVAVLGLFSFFRRRQTVDHFAELVKRSGLINDVELAQFLSNLADRLHESPPKNARQLADLLIEAELLNQWQADYLLDGKWKGFFLGGYRLEGYLRNNFMGRVYLARHTAREQLVAIKVLPSRFISHQNYLARFKREAMLTAALVHANVLRVYDLGQVGETLYYVVMEHIDGRDLQQTVEQDGRLTTADAANYIAQVALALQHCHDAGLIHRDVKPANMLVDHECRVKLFNFELAKFPGSNADSACEFLNNAVVGSADYLAPEQALNCQAVDGRADIYSLGCTLYFLLTGRPPFPHGTIGDRLLKHQNEQPQSIYEFRRDAPPVIVDLCQRMMSKHPKDRLQSASLVAQEIAAWSQ